MTSSATLTWYGHSNMFLQSGDVSVLVDPFFEGNPLAPDWKTVPRPDIIAVTHDHGDHLGQAVPLALASGATVACIVELAPLFVYRIVFARWLPEYGTLGRSPSDDMV